VAKDTLNERRRQTRSRKTQAGELRILFEDFNGARSELVAKLTDGAEGGIGIETGMALLPGTAVSISGDVGEPRPARFRKGSVRWCHAGDRGTYFCGLRFEDWTEQDRGAQTRLESQGPRDYYDVLQLSPKADPDTIHRVFRLLAQRYHPDNRETGNEEAFKQVLEAYEVLGNPERRASYDVRHLAGKRERWRIFDQPRAAVGVEAEKKKRQGVISLLYTRRMAEPEHPTIPIQELEDLLGCPREHLEFTLWYLKENALVSRTDNGRYSITAKGVDYAESCGIWRPPDESRMIESGELVGV